MLIPLWSSLLPPPPPNRLCHPNCFPISTQGNCWNWGWIWPSKLSTWTTGAAEVVANLTFISVAAAAGSSATSYVHVYCWDNEYVLLCLSSSIYLVWFGYVTSDCVSQQTARWQSMKCLLVILNFMHCGMIEDIFVFDLPRICSPVTSSFILHFTDSTFIPLYLFKLKKGSIVEERFAALSTASFSLYLC